MSSRVDIAVVGGGPSGLLIALELASRGVSVCVFAGPDQDWTASYGVWSDEAERLGWTGFVKHEWSAVEVRTPSLRKTLERPYTRLDANRFRLGLLERLAPLADVRFERVVSLDHGRRTHVVGQDSDVRARVVIDCTGGEPQFTSVHPASRYQTAFGAWVEVDTHPFDLDAAILMDWRSSPHAVGTPSFLYALPLSRKLVFVEETVLAGRGVAPLATLERRLFSRLRALHIHPVRVLETERCVIPLDARPRFDRRPTLAFGAAGGLVHPASGYQLAVAGTRAGTVAAAIAAAIDHGASPMGITIAGRRALWSVHDRLVWEFMRFGLRRLCELDQRHAQDFFERFFELPEASWRAFLGSSPGLVPTMITMARLFPTLEASTRRRLAAAGLWLPFQLARQVAVPLGG